MERVQGQPVRVACSLADDVQSAVDEIADVLGASGWSAVLFFASARYSMPDLASAMFEAFPDAITVGCSTMGEIGPRGLTRGGVVAIAFPDSFGFAAVPIDLDSFLFKDGGRIVAELVTRLRGEPSGLSAERHVFVTLTDGLSGKEEILVASLGTHAPGVPLVGGSAGDDWTFQGTWVALEGQAFPRAAIVMLIEPNVSFQTFHLHHFRPSETRMVVTSADPDRRIVREIDGWPAVGVLAGVLGVDEEALRSDPVPVLAERQVAFAFRVGDRFYLRTVMTVLEEGLLMGGAVEEGAVLRLMSCGDLVEETRRGVHQAIHARGRAAGLLLFNCGGRMLEAEARGVQDALCDAMCPPDVPVCGFTTYGEQFGPMQVNSTLTGLVLYRDSEDGS